MKFKGFILGLLLCCFTCVAFANVPLMPVKDLKPGMQGIGKTVIKGDTIEEFNVEVIGPHKPPQYPLFCPVHPPQ